VEKLLGKLSLQTRSEPPPDRTELIDEINSVIRPPRPVTEEDICLGVLDAASNQVNLQGGCFEQDELERLAQLAVGAPVLVGHRKQDLPSGRVFKAEVVTRQGIPWLRAYFYWSRRQTGAESLKAGIEAGVYAECSLAFQYERPECSVCREDMRHCRHRIGEPSPHARSDIRSFFYYKQIVRLLEISLVYRGAVEGTTVGTLRTDDSLTEHEWDFDPFWRCHARPIFALHQIDAELDRVVAEPFYNGIWLDVAGKEGDVSAVGLDGREFRHPLLQELKESITESSYRLMAQLLPKRGSSRLTLLALAAGEAPTAALVLFDIYELNGRDLRSMPLASRKQELSRLIRRNHRIYQAPFSRCSFPELLAGLDKKGSGLGLLMTDAGAGSARCWQLRRQPLVRGQVSDGDGRLQILFDAGAQAVCYPLDSGGNRLQSGDVIWAQPATDSNRAFRFVDLCQPGDLADGVETAAFLSNRAKKKKFDLLRDSEGDAWLLLHCSDGQRLLQIRKLDIERLAAGRKFWCCGVAENRRPGRVMLLDSGKAAQFDHEANDGFLVILEGKRLRGSYSIQPSQLGGKRGFLFYTAPSITSKGGR
jgi:hypothetical protein